MTDDLRQRAEQWLQEQARPGGPYETQFMALPLVRDLLAALVQAQKELADEHEASRNDPAEQRAERYAMEAAELSLKLVQATPETKETT